MRATALFLVLFLLPAIAFSGYTERNYEWTVSSASTWEDKDLSSYVSANAICEVICFNHREAEMESLGVRTNGSSINRYKRIHEGEGGGRNTFRMTAVADGSSIIECFASHDDSCGFILVGYWDSGTYVELTPTQHTVAGTDWEDETFSEVAASSVIEVLMYSYQNTSELTAGVRANGSSLERSFVIHECEPTYSDGSSLTLFVEVDASKVAEIRCASGNAMDFYCIGYWSVLPGTWSEKMYEIPDNVSADAWEDEDLSGQITDGAVLEVVSANLVGNFTFYAGARENESSNDRRVLIDEAEGGGYNYWSGHVTSDAGGVIETYQDDLLKTSNYITGEWVIAAPTYRRRIIISE